MLGFGRSGVGLRVVAHLGAIDSLDVLQTSRGWG